MGTFLLSIPSRSRIFWPFGIPCYGWTSVVLCLCLSGAAVEMSNHDGLLVPRPARMEGPSVDEWALVWAVVVESGNTATSTLTYEAPDLQQRSVYATPSTAC